MSQAYSDFLASLNLAESLLLIESAYPDPAPPEKRKSAEGLRGGAAVLMVAAFENFLKELVEEHLDGFTQLPLIFRVEDLPREMLLHNITFLIEDAKKTDTLDRVQAYTQMATTIVSGVLSPAPFTEAVRSNPNSKKLQELFKRLGSKRFFEDIKPDFDLQWGSPTADTFIKDYLDGILQRRHTVAHTANALNISRFDLQESLRFLKLLGLLCDNHIEKHVNDILSTPR